MKSFILAGALLIAAGAASAAPITINFDYSTDHVGGDGDGLVLGSNPGAFYAGMGVLFDQVNGGATATGGQNLGTLSPGSGDFLMYRGNGAVSEANYIYAGGTNDLLMTFTQAVTSISVDIDIYQPESADDVRLAALVRNGDGTYSVLAVSATVADNPVSTITLTVAPGQSFLYAIFQSTTEQEGFDNLTFQVIPLPSAALMGTAGLAGLGFFSRRRRAL
jgi:hypothetical protein